MWSKLASSLLVIPLSFAATAFASVPAVNSSSTQSEPISTGVTPVELLHHPKGLDMPSDQAIFSVPEGAKIELRVNVTRRGETGHVRILHSDDPALNTYAIAAVHHYRWLAARLDHRAIRAPVNLTLRISQ